jgi:hypothetical protein
VRAVDVLLKQVTTLDVFLVKRTEQVIHRTNQLEPRVVTKTAVPLLRPTVRQFVVGTTRLRIVVFLLNLEAHAELSGMPIRSPTTTTTSVIIRKVLWLVLFLFLVLVTWVVIDVQPLAFAVMVVDVHSVSNPTTCIVVTTTLNIILAI